MPELGTMIRMRRHQLHMSQSTLSRLANIPQGDVSLLERNKAYLGPVRLTRLVRALGGDV